MVWLVNKAERAGEMNKQNSGMTVEPSPLPGEIKHFPDSSWDLTDAVWIDEVPTFELPIVDLDQLPRQVGWRVIPKSSPWSSSVMDDRSLCDQPTWLLPVIPGPGTIKTQALPSGIQVPSGENYLGLIRNLVKNSGIYAISSLASPLITLLLGPFLTRTLSRTDYGVLVVLNTIVALVTGVTELGLGGAFMRLYSYDCKTRREQLDALSTLVLLLLLILIPIAIIGVLLAPWLSALMLGSASNTVAVRVAVVLVLTQNLTVPSLMWLRIENRAVLFSTISIANLLMTAGANVALVGMLHMGITGSLVASGLGDVIIIACTLPVICWQAGFHLRFFLAGSMLAFGVPNVVNLMSSWVLQLSDRYLLGHLASFSLAAGYSVAYTLGGVVSTAIIAPFSMSWYVLVYPIAKREDAQHVFALTLRGYSFVLLFATLGLSLFGRSALDLLFPASYHAQSPIIPVIALSTMFYGIYAVVNLGVKLKRKTWLVSLYFIVSSLINVGLNFVLIPAYGTMGAALATLLAYIMLALLAYFFNQRIYPVPFEVGQFLVVSGIGITLYLIDNGLTGGPSTVVVWGIHIGTLLLYGLCLLCLGWPELIARIMHSFPYLKRYAKGL